MLKAATITTSGRHVNPSEDVLRGDKDVSVLCVLEKKRNKRDDDSSVSDLSEE